MTNGADCDVDCEATKQCAGVSELATVFGQKQKPWAVKTQIKIIRKKSRGISKRQQQKQARRCSIFGAHCNLKLLSASQSWNEIRQQRATKRALKNYKKKKQQKTILYNSTSLSICSYEFIACPRRSGISTETETFRVLLCGQSAK